MTTRTQTAKIATKRTATGLKTTGKAGAFIALYKMDFADKINTIRSGVPAQRVGELSSVMGMPKEALMDSLGLSRATINRKVQREQTLSPAQFLHLAGRFGAPVEYPFVKGLDGFPQREADVSPTELGNLLRAVEDYARTRYGLDLVLVWPRLYKVLPTEAASSIASAKAEIELQLVTTELSLTFGIGLSVALSVLHASAALLCGWLWGCVAVAFLSYRSAVASTLAYGDEIRSALDLHRRGLLAAAQTGAGLGDHDERTQWELLMRLWYSGLPIEVERAPAGPTAAPAPGPARGSAHPIASRLGASVPPLVGALTLTALLNAILFAAA